MKMSSHRIIALSCAAGCIVGVIYLLNYDSRRPQGDDLRVGVLVPLTGDASSYGQKAQKAIELAVDDLNARNSGSHRKVVAVFEDSKGTPKDGVSAVQKLISVDKVPAIVGDVLSAVTLPAAPIAEENKVILMSPCSSAPAITQSGKFIYRVWPSDLAEGTAAAQFAVSRQFTSAAVLHLNNDYGNAIANIFQAHFSDAGGKIVLKTAYVDSTTDWRALVSPLAAANADVVYVAGYYKDTAAILRTATELGIKKQFIGTTAIEDENLIALAAGAAEGIVYPLASGYDPSSSESTSKAFSEAFQKRFGYEPGWMEAHAYDAFMIICTASESAGDVTGNSIRERLDSMGTYQGVTGPIQFDENGDVRRPVIYKTVKDGKFVRLPENP